MGAIETRQLIGPAQDDVDAAQEVGAVDWRLHVPVMSIAESCSQIVYSEENLVRVATVWRIAEDRKQRFRWWRLEAKVALPPENDWVSADDTLIVTEHPYSTNWTQFAPFKRSTHNRSRISDPLRNAAYASRDDIVRHIEDLETDFWETGKYLTAGISVPEAPFIPEDTGRSGGKQSVLVFGHATSANAVIEKVLTEPKVQKVLRQTQTGQVRLPARAGLAASDIRLYDELREEGHSLMYHAIRQALAGPHKDSGDWLGRAVSDKAIHIYLGHLHNWNRKIASEKKKME